MTSAKLLLTLGPGLSPTPHGDVAVLDWGARRFVDTFRYAHTVYRQSHKGLTGATLRGARLLVSSEVELLEFELAPLRLVDSRTFLFLNDVHHMAAAGESIWVCNTGLDCLEEFDADWQHRATHPLVPRFGRSPGDVWRLLRDDLRKSTNRLLGRYDYYTHLSERPPFRNVVKLLRESAYRTNGRELRFCDFRPHVLHPNHVLPVEDDVWVTLWRTGEIVSLHSGRRIAAGLGRPHDGVLHEGRLFVTDAQSNRLLMLDCSADSTTRFPVAMSKNITGDISAGFLRGVCVVGDLVYVGLTARRGAPPDYQSARIIALDRNSLDVVDEWEVPPDFGRQIYSIVDVSRVYG